MISSGDLDRRIELQSATLTNDGEYNEQTETWATYDTVWAKQEFHRSEEGELSARDYAEYGLYFTIRYRDDIEPTHRLVYESENYQMIGRPREIGRRQFLKIRARLVE
jgi:SPP1 family predicted phage head-tail adaptor